MNLWEGMRIALASLWGHKLRTFLTLLGNIVGTMSVIAVVSLIYGADSYVAEAITEEGTDVFTITRVNGLQFLTDFEAFLESLTNPDLTVDDRDYLTGRMEEARLVSAEVNRSADLTAAGNRFRGVNVRGVTEDYVLLKELPLLLGRHLTRQDLLASRQVVVLGFEVARDLFPRRADPVGQEVKIGGRHFKVVGVVEDRGMVMGNNRNQFAVVPITSYQKVFGSGQSVDIKVAAADLSRIEEAKDEATFLMRMRHRRRPLERDDFAIQTSDQLLTLWSGISGAIYGALVPLVGISWSSGASC
jgi:putative ABC transport system permease protein